MRKLSANLQQRCYRNIGLAVQMMWQFEAVGRRPLEDGPAWNAFKNVRKPRVLSLPPLCFRRWLAVPEHLVAFKIKQNLRRMPFVTGCVILAAKCTNPGISIRSFLSGLASADLRKYCSQG